VRLAWAMEIETRNFFATSRENAGSSCADAGEEGNYANIAGFPIESANAQFTLFLRSRLDVPLEQGTRGASRIRASCTPRL
jgi:hypothetical protein